MIREKIAQKLLKLYKPNVIKYLHNIRNMFNDFEKIKQYQYHRLEKLLFHAYENTTYYRQIFDNVNLFSNGKINWGNFSHVPILTKEIIRSNYRDLISKDSKTRKSYKNTSGGSTGEPVVFIQDKVYYEHMIADTLWFSELHEKKIGEKEIKIWGSEKDIFKEKESIVNRLTNYFFNRTLLNSFHLNDEIINNYVKILNTVKPKSIWAYVDSIFEIAKYINFNNAKVFNPKIIICTAGTMYPEFREDISKAFPNSKILNQYGSREVGIIGIGEKELQIFQHSIFMELYDKITGKYIHNSGSGNIIVTSLNNFSMPLIKFDIGDIGESSDIDNTNVRSLSKLTGRRNSHIIRQDGSFIHGELFTHLFYFIDDIRKFQVIQEDYNRFLIKLEIASNALDSDVIMDIQKKINQIMDDECEIDFQLVDEIQKLQSGKFQFVTSKVQHD